MPADVIGAAVKVMRIAIGEIEEDVSAPAAAAAKPGPRGPYKKRCAEISN